MKEKERCGRCGDVKVLTNGGMFCEDCKLTLQHEQELELERN